jgi:uncharacterized membrane protein
MTFAEPLPWWALGLAVLAAASASVLVYRGASLPASRRGLLTALRFATLMLLVGLFMRPVTRHAAATDAVVPILVDTSRSMGIEDEAGGRRIDRARALVSDDLLPALAARFDVEVLAYGESLNRAAPDELTASARQSDLAGALEAVATRYGDRPIAGIVLLSDGGRTGSVHPSSAIPVFPIGLGSAQLEHDREVLSVTALEAVLDDSRLDLAVLAVTHGEGTEPIEMRLLENGRPIDVRHVRAASAGTPVREVFQVTPAAPGPTVYTVEIPVAPGELVPENNTRSLLVPAPARPRRVLLVQGAPGFEHSFLRRAWRADRGLEVDAVVRQGRNDEGADTFYIQAHPSRSAALADGFPATRGDLFAYDAVVVANVDRELLSPGAMEALRDFVGRRGGGLLVLGARSLVGGGLRGTPIADLLPLDPADRSRGVVPAVHAPGASRGLTLTAAGETHPIMQLAPSLEETRRRWDAMPALASVAPLGVLRPGAVVLASAASPSGTGGPVVAVQRYGEGRTLLFTGEAAWRWRMRMPSEDRSYDTFWRQALRWIALPAVDPVHLAVPGSAAPGDVLPLQVTVRSPLFEPLESAVVFRVTRPDGGIDTVPASADREAGEGVRMARYRAADPGVYQVSADASRPGGPPLAASAWMLVGGADHEMADPRLDVRALQRLAAGSGGRLIDGADVSALVEVLGAATPAAVRRVQRDTWHSTWFLVALVLMLSAEWALRQRWGLR